MPKEIAIGKDKNDFVDMYLSMANRHGLVSGATGTGKTVTLQRIAEQLSDVGIPVFTADVKGDLSGIAFPGSLENTKIKTRLDELKIKNFTPHGCPVVFWDVYGKMGHPLRTTLSELGPILLGRLLNLNDTQQGVLNAVFKMADDQGLLVLDLKDLETLLSWAKDNASSLQDKYGNINAATVGAIQRGLLVLSTSGGDNFFGEPAFDIQNLFQKNADGKGIINILDATQLIQNPLLYSTFLLWLLSELFEKLPEVGDLDQPKLVFFFDEAHLLFDSAPKPLLDKIEQMVRLIRSKGVGVFFVTQSPLDVPEDVLGQLGNRAQHALRAFTPKDQKAIRAAAQTFRQNPKLDTEKVISELGVGEALVSFLDPKGTPTVVRRTLIIPPSSRIGSITETERQKLMQQSPFYGRYEKAVDRESAYEILTKRMEEKTAEPSKPVGRPRQSATEAIIISTARSVGTTLGRQIIRGILGSIFKK